MRLLSVVATIMVMLAPAVGAEPQPPAQLGPKILQLPLQYAFIRVFNF